MEALLWIGGIILAIYLAIEYWPITLILVICLIAYYVNRKNKRETCENSINEMKERITRTENIIEESKKQLRSWESKEAEIEDKQRKFKEKRQMLIKDATFFSTLFMGENIDLPRCMHTLDAAINKLERMGIEARGKVGKLKQEIQRESQNLTSYNSTLSTLNTELQSLKK